MTNYSDKPYVISESSSIREALLSLNRSTTGICVVVDEIGRLVDTITDGDIRRAILDSIGIDESIEIVSQRKRQLNPNAPTVGFVESTDGEILELMRRQKILHIPIVNADGLVVDLKLMRDLIPSRDLGLDALIMAGGLGTRLMPLTENTPKPMLEVGGKPILEHIIGQLRDAEVAKVALSTNYLGEKISDYFGDGGKFGVDIDYVRERSPMGTAGALGLIEPTNRPLLVMNGDIMTKVDFRSMLAFHEEHAADITVGVARYQFQVPYGVIECDGPTIVSLTEKPDISVFVSAGIYLLNPSVVALIDRGRRMDMPELINRAIESNRVAVSFPIVEYWLDIGAPAEFEQANTDFSSEK